jgi:hypothetical protein
MRIAHPATALALWIFLVPPVFASDIPVPGDSAIPAEMDTPADIPGPADPASPAELEYPGDPQEQAAPEAAAGSEEPEGAFSGGAEAAGEDVEALPLEVPDLEMTVYYDERT